MMAAKPAIHATTGMKKKLEKSKRSAPLSGDVQCPSLAYSFLQSRRIGQIEALCAAL
jgi:hypothetical protein